MTPSDPHWSDEAMKSLAESIRALQRRAKVLIVDDNQRNVDMLEHTLKSFSCDISTCQTSLVAAELVATRDYDIVFLDLRMPTNGGLAVMRRALQLLKPPKFVVVTGFAKLEEAEEARRMGAVTIMEKPITKEDLESIFGKLKD